MIFSWSFITFSLIDKGLFNVEVISSVNDYVEMVKEIFDFSKIKELLAGGKFRVLIDSMHGGTKYYVQLPLTKELVTIILPIFFHFYVLQ